MKKTLKTLSLNKKVISALHQKEVRGGNNTHNISQGDNNTCQGNSPMQFFCAS